MDWKYILNVDPEELKDEEKDELYNSVTWFEFDRGKVDSKKLEALLKLSQEILKYKGEQVETLLHELEEMAIKQGEEEARKQESDTEPRSSRSRKSSSLEYENLEQKYLELKSKNKKVTRSAEKKEMELNKLNNKVKLLEQENRRLQKELQSGPRETGSESDISETVREQQKELVESLQNKNKQISDLLRDIEDVEKENFVLREKLSKVKDELSVATKEMTSTTEILEKKEKILKESADNLEKLKTDYDDLMRNFDKLQEDKNKLECEFKEQLIKMKETVEELEQKTKQKEEEIQHLKSLLKEPSVNSSISSLPKDDSEQSHIAALQKILADRDRQLLELRTQLQVATKEMVEGTELLKKMKREKEEDSRKFKELEKNIVEMKKMLNVAHERSQNMQDELAFAEETVRNKDEELKKIYENMKENGQVDLVAGLENIQALQFENRSKRKQIMSLVKTTNKLQNTCDKFEKENYALRHQLGLAEADEVDVSSFTLKMKAMKKEMDTLKSNSLRKEEQTLKLKTEIHKLNQTISSFANQIVDLGQKPEYNNLNVAVVKDESLKDEIKALGEENEALRKGMHEILDSINKKKTESLNEIKSDTLETLLRALDVKHISGWYHPAMRLQAELHNLQGVNAALRDQLRQVRSEAENRSVEPQEEKAQQDSDAEKMLEFTSIEITEDNIKSVLDNIFSDDALKECSVVHQQVLVWFQNVFEANRELKQSLKSTEEVLRKLEEDQQVLLDKLKILLVETDEDKARKIDEVVESNVSMKRQLCYLENEVQRLVKKLEKLHKDFNNAEIVHTKSLGELERKNNHLMNDLKVLRNENEMLVDLATFRETETKLEQMTVKYRELAASVRRQEEETILERAILIETRKSLEADKLELKNKLVALLSKQTSDEKLQKLAESEMNQISERQRADHTNNLYELVKEQLHKSEERFQEFTKYNEDLLKRNFQLQEQLKEAEDKIRDHIDGSLYEQLQKTNNELSVENQRLTSLVAKLEEDLRLQLQKEVWEVTWNNGKEQELLNLKHQVVDLISSSDEKVTIAQLNGDVLQYRQSQNYYKAKWEETTQRLSDMKEMYEKEISRYEEEKTVFEERILALNKTIGNVRKLFNILRLQYLGCVPLCSEQLYIDNIKMINKQRHEIFLSLHRAKSLENEAELVREQLNKEMEFGSGEVVEGCKEEYRKVMNWMQEKKVFQINELRYKRQLDFKEAQLQHFTERVRMQDEQIARLDEELLLWHKNFDGIFVQKQQELYSDDAKEVPTLFSKSFASVEVQTLKESKIYATKEVMTQSSDSDAIKEELFAKDQKIDQLKSKISEHEMTISMFRKQIGDKQSQITFYERHIMELQNKKADVHIDGAGGDNINVRVERPNNNEEVLAIKATVRALQEDLQAKDEEIVKYQTLLKVDRDKHSLAAATLQEELQNIQRLLAEEKEKNLSLEQNFTKSHPNRAAVEQYMRQVHALEQHTAELHTRVSSLEAGLQSSREEVVRWRTLANDRLKAMEELRQNLDNQHEYELEIYKSDTEKLKELSKDEANSLRQLISKQKMEVTGRLDEDVQRLFKEKDDRIHELIVKLRQMKSITVKKGDHSESEVSMKLSDLETSKEMLTKENDLLKKRYEQLAARERNLKEENRELKAQLLKKPNSARSDKAEKSIKDQLQKKIITLENELSQSKQALSEQIAINETHRVQANEDFGKWKKMKHWQQTTEKLKSKLKEKESEFEKLQQTTAGYRLLIERLEREKHNLENRIKNLKSANVHLPDYRELEMVKIENMKLLADVETLNSKLEMQQHHSGGLGAAMMQEKLESQERKIAVLELAAKGTVEVRAEIERLQATISNLHKSNIKLEAENLDLNLDLEQSRKDVPHLQQQIQHLENYIDVLKAERSKNEVDNEHSATAQPEAQKVSELERTVFILKRVVEKLQAENKRLVGGKRPLSERSVSAEKLKRDHLRLKEKHTECIQKIANLEQELSVEKNKLRNYSVSTKPDDDKLLTLSDELSKVKNILEQKSSLLDKVKILLHRAAAKEKSLLQEIAELKNQKGVGISPIPEESEGSSSPDL